MNLPPKFIRSFCRVSGVLALLLVLAACSEPALAPAPQTPTDAFGGFAEISFSDLNSNPDASVSVLDTATISGQTFDFQGGISFDSATRVVAIEDVGPNRFISVDIDVLNGSGAMLSNITFLPFSQQGVSFNDSSVGAMGTPMAHNLREAGYLRGVYNRTKAKTEPFAERAVSVYDSPKDLAAAADVVAIIVTDDAALSDVLQGDEGVLAGLQGGSVVINV
ncbi:MAG: NAD(P)-binding domain-containing protein [Trueperaceae bacterium]|nr:NAD(P)-binding domain-containing protein [Trueperaceae bacterium]